MARSFKHLPSGKLPAFIIPVLLLLNAGAFCQVNPEHDFPKKIAYKLTGKTIKATISDNDKSIDFLFVRME